MNDKRKNRAGFVGGAAETLVDARGYRCPVPTLRLQRALRFAQPGQLIRLLADDPLARIDVPHFVSQAGLDILSVKVEKDLLSILVRKPA
jgi:tRNA 2-thiouridine synthesizing protein A